MDPASEISKEVVVPIVKRLLRFVKEHVTYMICYKKNVEKMRSCIGSLQGKISMVEDQVEADKINSVAVHTDVETWLVNARKSLENAEKISGDKDVVSKGCLNLKERYILGKGASDQLQEINNLVEKELNIILSKNEIPLGMVVGKGAAAVSKEAIHRLPSIVQMDGISVFNSRRQVYADVLKALVDDKTCIMAIWGMAGVGKTTMIDQLEKTAREKQMFDWIMKAVITADPKVNDIQQAIAECMNLRLSVETTDLRAKRLANAFKEASKGGSKKILVILDDVWDPLNLELVGLSPLPTTSAGFKIILTTRNKDVCTGMKVENNAIFELGVLENEEPLDLFKQAVELGVQNFADSELEKIGEEIVKECAGLPLAITTVAGTLKASSIRVWKDTLARLRNSELEEKVNVALSVSFDYLNNDDAKEVFSLCCLFREDFDVPIEDLARYALGLGLYRGIFNMDEVRTRTYACIEKLRSVNLLLESEYEDCIKMHDVVRDYGINHAPNGEGLWLVNHGNMEEWPQQELEGEPYTRISLQCSHMQKLPSTLKCRNLKLLKLRGNPSTEFPAEFYEGMEKLCVLDYQEMNYHPSLLPCGSHQVINKLRTLSLHSCKLGDLSMIGNLKNLEILSFADCGVSELPAEIGNLSRLKLLDVTGCKNLRIKEGVVENLVKLEELYMRSAPSPYSVCKFTDSNCAALGARFEKLTALEFEFYQNKVEASPTFFKKLKRFTISIGCHLDGKDSEVRIPFKNTVMLKTTESELLRSGIRELFKMTERLVFEVKDIDCICNISNAKDFSNVRTLKLEGCNKLKFAFSHSMVKCMRMLERLEVKSCENIEEVMEYESGEEEIMEDIASGGVVKFLSLRFLYLYDLPNLVSFCKTGASEIRFPQLEEIRIESLGKITSIFQTAAAPTAASDSKSAMYSLFNQKVASPKLQTLNIRNMENMREIWASQYRREDFNLCAPITIQVWFCSAIEVIFDIDFGEGNNNSLLCHEREEEHQGTNSLRNILAESCGNLKHVWRIKGVNSNQIIRDFKTLTFIGIWYCDNFRHIFTPSTATINLGGLESIEIEGSKQLGRSGSDDVQMEGSSTSVQKILCENTQKEARVIAFPSYLSRRFNNLQVARIHGSDVVDVAFEIGEVISGGFGNGNGNRSQQVLLPLPQLKYLSLWYLNNMSHVWKWNELLDPRHCQPQLCVVGFQNLTKVEIGSCRKIKYLFLPQIAKNLVALQSLTIRWCEEMQAIVSDGEDDDNGGQEMVDIASYMYTYKDATLFPQLRKLELRWLNNLSWIGGTNATTSNAITNEKLQIVGADSLSQKSCTDLGRIEHAQVVSFANLHDLNILKCPRFRHAIPSYVAGQLLKLETVKISNCEEMVELFDIEDLNNRKDVGEGFDESVTISRSTKMNLYQLPNLTEMTISNCNGLRYLFPFYVVRSLQQLKKLYTEECFNLGAIVKEEDGEDATNTEAVRFRCLQSLTLKDLQNLETFSMSRNDFKWPLLDEVKIINCPGIRMFTHGQSTTPQLKYIYTSLGKHSLEGHINSNTCQSDQFFPSSDSDRIEHLRFPWSLSNLIQVNEIENEDLLHIFSLPVNELSKLQQLEEIRVYRCDSIVGVFEALDGASNDMNERVQSVVKFPKLRKMSLERLPKLEYIWKRSTVLEFTNLTKLFIFGCHLLKHVFTSSMVASFVQLQELKISNCREMEAVVTEAEKEEKEEGVEDKDIVFPDLKYLQLDTLASLKGFCLQKNAFKWPSLETLVVKRCAKITVFTSGHSSALKLKEIDTDFGLCDVTEDPNTFIPWMKQQGLQF